MEMQLPIIHPYNKINMLSKQTSLFIPKGPKFFAWFTYIENKPVCLFIDACNDKENKLSKVPHYVSFREELSIGTLLYGTMIQNYFVCEKVCLFKNEKVFEDLQLSTMKTILEMIRDSDYLGSISFKLPYMANNSFILECSNLPYSIYGILQKSRIFIIQSILGGFQIKKRAEMEDIYDLYILNDKNKSEFYATALVNDFKTSHFLKTLFYKRKANYKSIEFSDSDDEEYEKDVYVGCLYINEFKKWKPYGFKNMDFLKTILFLEKKNIMV